MRVESFAALTRRGTDSYDAAAFLRDHVRHAVMNHGVNAFQIHADHLIPFALGELFDRRVLLIPDAGIGDKDIQAAKPFARKIYKFFRIGRLAQISLQRFHTGAVLACFLLHLFGSLAIAMIVEDDVRTSLCEEFYSCGPNAARAPSYECG